MLVMSIHIVHMHQCTPLQKSLLLYSTLHNPLIFLQTLDF